MCSWQQIHDNYFDVSRTEPGKESEILVWWKTTAASKHIHRTGHKTQQHVSLWGQVSLRVVKSKPKLNFSTFTNINKHRILNVFTHSRDGSIILFVYIDSIRYIFLAPKIPTLSIYHRILYGSALWPTSFIITCKVVNSMTVSAMCTHHCRQASYTKRRPVLAEEEDHHHHFIENQTTRVH